MSVVCTLDAGGFGGVSKVTDLVPSVSNSLRRHAPVLLPHGPARTPLPAHCRTALGTGLLANGMGQNIIFMLCQKSLDIKIMFHEDIPIVNI